MNIALNINERLTFSTAIKVMAEKLDALKKEKISYTPDPKIIRLQIKIQPQSILSWLAQQQHETLFYWADREGKFQVGGVGIADRISQQQLIELCTTNGKLFKKTKRNTDHHIVIGKEKVSNYDLLFEQIRKNFSNAPEDVRYYGGMAFDPQNLDQEWNDFGVCHFLLPRFELLHQDSKTIFACNLLLEKHALDNVTRELKTLNTAQTSMTKDTFFINNRQDFPDYTAWSTMITEALDSLKVGGHQKIVLARKSILKLNARLNPFLFLQEMEAKNNRSFHFCFQPTKTSAFWGASPERLYERQGNSIKTEAIAGTRPRAKSSLETQKLKQELLNSPKEVQEHEYVCEFIRDQLQKLCSNFQSTEHLSILEVQEGMHLASRFEGALKNNFSDTEILKNLHPTPAVAGTPAHWAVDAISFYEPFSRGWYAGPVGWIGKEGAEFAVAIRSALIRDDQIALFSGAGIVKGSTPENEWNEIENKMSSFMKMFHKVTDVTKVS